MPDDILGIVHDKSTWGRRGIAVQNTVIEPGWRGFLTLELSNHSSRLITIENGDPIAQIVFHLLAGATDSPYRGKYQDQINEPVKAISERDQ
jgi:dCTP deaminase